MTKKMTRRIIVGVLAIILIVTGILPYMTNKAQAAENEKNAYHIDGDPDDENTSGNAENLIPAGDIKLGDMFRLYRYENWFYQITMSGKEVRTWLECSASKVVTNEDGTYGITGGLTYYDVIYGDGFSYVIDPSAPSRRQPHSLHDLQRQRGSGYRYLHHRYQQLSLQRRRQLCQLHQRARLRL